MIGKNLNKILKDVETVCQKVGRNPKDITLIAVSKTQPIDMIKQVCQKNIIDFGENHVLELCDKVEALPQNINWHMIGHLQTNKVKKLISQNITLIHSVDSIKLAKKINDEAIKLNKNISILLEINIANDKNKYGFKADEIDEVIKKIQTLSNINLKGLMCVAPYQKNPENNRVYFKKMKQLLANINKTYNLKLSILSMGMSNDYKIAIEEGSTMIRVGTAIFGKRQ